MKNKFENLDVVGKSKIFYIISCSVIVLAILVTAIFGLDISIQFKGGTLIKYSFTGDVDHEAVASAVEEAIDTSVTVTEGDSIGSSGKFLQISVNSTAGLTADVQYEITQALKTQFAANEIELLESSDVNPTTGRDFFLKCLVAVIFAFIVLVIYVGIRFRRIAGWSAGVTAIIALLHDVAIVYAAFVFFRIAIDANFMAVVLTILAYSVNDTIVIYDRVRENRRIYGAKMTAAELINKSVSQSMTRSIRTSVTTVAALVVMCIVGIVSGVDTIISFALPLIFGMIAGTYSSICIAGPLWVLWQDHSSKKPRAKKRRSVKA